jgi:alkanesulfonate monooxygenase SsuD/methylene tetrahydromethanopterin reductase-like flavin-dependent oxidoreductase (luciferase family)
MEIGIAIPQVVDREHFIEHVEAVERAGVHAIWTYDSGRSEEPFAISGFLASRTSRVQLCCGILNPFIRHPTVLASGAATVDRLSGGRCRLVVGLGWAPEVERVLGVSRPRPFGDSQEGIRIIKRLLRGEEVTHRAASFGLSHAKLEILPLQPDLPVYVAGGGSRGLQMALQETDGFLTDAGRGAPEYVAWMRQHLLHTPREDRGSFKLGLYLSLHVNTEQQVARESLLRGVAWSLATTPYEQEYYNQVGVERRLIEEVRQQMGIDEIITQNRDPRQVISPTALTRAARVIPDRIADTLIAASAVIGSVEECSSRLARYAQQGVDFVLLECTRRYDETIIALGELVRKL